MADSTAEQAGQTAEGGDKTYTQEQVNDIVAKRLARVKATPPDDYEELRAKAARLDELEEASKSELQKATERADKLKRELDGLKAEAKRREEVAAAAEKHGVDAELLGRMAGDPEENAGFLAAREGGARRYPQTRDSGEKPGAGDKNSAARQAAKMLFGGAQ